MCLHPRVLSEGLGSLLPEPDRAAVLWMVRIDGDGEVTSCARERATVSAGPWHARQFLVGPASDEPATLALMTAGARLMRGAGYRALPTEQPIDADELIHAAVGGLYARVTVPLRRLADRFAAEVCPLGRGGHLCGAVTCAGR